MHAVTYLAVDLTQTCTYSSNSIKGCKCQPENSSLVLLVFPHNSQRDHPPELIASAFGQSLFFQFPRVTVDAVGLWAVSSDISICSPKLELSFFCSHPQGLYATNASPILCSKNHYLLEMISNTSIIMFQGLCLMTTFCSSSCSLWGACTT